MKHIIYPLLTGLLATACQPGNDFTVNGTLAEPFTGQVYLTCIKDRLTKVDSLTLDGGTTFKFTGTMERPDYYRIMTSPRTYDASLIIEPGSEYHMNILDTHDCQVEVVRGGKEQLLLNEYEQLMMPIRETDQRLGDAYAQIERSDKQKTDSLQKLMSDNFLAREATTREFILQHPRTFTAAYLAGDLLLCTYPELKEIHEQIDTAAYAYNHNYLRFKEKYEEAASRWMQDRPAPEFTTHDLQGRKVKLSDFRGKYVLLDFWASWCAPCRKRAKELKAIYSDLQARGISICGISMDEDRKQWEAATREDGIVWTNTGDVKPFKENPIAAAYKVVSLPTLFLIGPDGTIVKQNPEIDDLLKLPLQ